MSYSRNALLGFCIALAGLSLGACAQKESVKASTMASTTGDLAPIVAGTALPAGYKVDLDRTIILGAPDKWTGRLSYTTSTGADEVFDFLHKEMANFGWTEATAMRSDLSLLTFISAATNRTATVSISRGSMLGSTRVRYGGSHDRHQRTLV